MAEPWTLVGVGSRLRGDDAVGLAVADRFRNRRDLRVVLNHGDPFGIVDVFASAPRVVVVDATRGAGTPGAVTVFEAGDQRLQATIGSSTHGFGAAESFDLAIALGTVPDRVVFVGIEVADLDGEELSPAVAAAVDDAVGTIEEVIGHA